MRAGNRFCGRCGYTYVLTVIKPDEIDEDGVRRALSTMVVIEQ